MQFQFKQFSVQQQEGVFKVGTDALLLGAWAEAGRAKRILDVGTGTGVIALMLAQRCSSIIDAIEVNPQAAELAQKNFAASPWSERLTVHQKSLQTFTAERAGAYDLVVSNPPFFNRSLPSANPAKNLARHTGELSHSDLLQYSNTLLKVEGNLALILPVNEGRQLIEQAKVCELFLSRLTVVYPTVIKPANRLLMELSKVEAKTAEDQFYIRDANGRFTEQYVALTRQYHTIFP